LREEAVLFFGAIELLLRAVLGSFRCAGLPSRHRSGHSRDWIKTKNPAAPAVKREAEEDWGKGDDDWQEPATSGDDCGG
jgi:hypothetical protein